jgi:hypothetical protein
VASRGEAATCSHAGFFLGLFFDPEDGGDAPPRRRSTFNTLHGVISQKIVLFITTAARTSYPKNAYSLTVIWRIKKGISSSKRHFFIFLADFKVRASSFDFTALKKLMLRVFHLCLHFSSARNKSAGLHYSVLYPEGSVKLKQDQICINRN